VSSGLKLSKITCSCLRSGGNRKNSLQNPSVRSASSAACHILAMLFLSCSHGLMVSHLEEGLIELHDLGLERLGSTLLSQG
jgi:hypothetical protein